MILLTTLEIILVIYAAAGGLYWLWMASGTWKIIRRMPVLKDYDEEELPRWPRLSVVIPACNEGATFESAVKTVLAADYPELEIVLVDDRSTDSTGEIIDRVAAGDQRVRSLHVKELPDGWLGKVHALQRGFEQTTGHWVLFTDADVHMSPDAFRRVVTYCERQRLDHLALAPDIWPSTLLADSAISSFLRAFMVGIRPWAVEDAKSKAFAGVGAFNMVRRQAFERTTGFEWLRLEVADDVGLGLMMKRAGCRCAVASGMGLVGLHWYRSVAEMAYGAEKGYASLGRCNAALLVSLVSLQSALEISPLVAAAAWFMPWLQFMGAAMLVVAAATIVALHRWVKRPLLSGLLVPAAVAVNLALAVRSAWLGFRRGGVMWRGTLYPSRVLREGSRVKIP